MTRKRKSQSLYFTNRQRYYEELAEVEKGLAWTAELHSDEEEAKTLKVGDTVTFSPELVITAVATESDWRTDNLDTLMEAAMAGDSLPTRTAQSLLLEAAEIVSGDRERTHGKKERSFEVIADFWDTYLTGRVDRATGRITALDVAQMMVLLKIARTIQGEPVWDHFIDAAGYSGVAGEIYASMKGTSHGPK